MNLFLIQSQNLAFVSASKYSQAMVFSNDLILENALDEYPDFASTKIHVIPQGRCEFLSTNKNISIDQDKKILEMLRPEGAAEGTTVVIGIGSVIFRKGVDLLLIVLVESFVLDAVPADLYG